MNKSDLQTGMVVESRGSQKALVLLNTHRGDVISGETWAPLSAFQEDLAYRGIPEADIVRVYQPPTNVRFHSMDVYEHDLIWERKKQITPEEAGRILNEHFNCEVVVKEETKDNYRDNIWFGICAKCKHDGSDPDEDPCLTCLRVWFKINDAPCWEPI